jgi:hypothetical protein
VSKNRKIAFLAILGISGALFALFGLPRIPQNPAYHHFADMRRFWGIPNAMNVLSNALLVLVGVLGMNLCRRNKRTDFRGLKAAFFTAVTLTGFGSMIYHWLPNNNTLFWDRLPMAVMFTTFCLIIIVDRISSKVAWKLFWPMNLVAVLSVFYWWIGELRGEGDLRLYGLIVFLPLLLIPVTITLLPSGTIRNRNIWIAICLYALAKLLEILDRPVYEWSGVVSGHTLKHVCAAASIYCLIPKNSRR